MQDRSSIWVLVGLLALLFLSRGCQETPPDNPPGPGQREKLATLGLLIVEDPSRRTPDQAALLTSPQFRQWAAASCRLLRVVPVSAVQADGQPSPVLGPWRDYVRSAGIQGNESSALPAVLLVRSDGSVYQAGRLPDSSDGVRAWCESLTLP